MVVTGVALARSTRGRRANHGRGGAARSEQRRLPVQIINDEVIDVVVRVSARVKAQVVGDIFYVTDVSAKLEGMSSAGNGHRVKELVALLIRERGALQERRHAKLDTVGDENIGSAGSR